MKFTTIVIATLLVGAESRERVLKGNKKGICKKDAPKMNDFMKQASYEDLLLAFDVIYLVKAFHLILIIIANRCYTMQELKLIWITCTKLDLSLHLSLRLPMLLSLELLLKMG
jgi:hypothetical protein